MNIRILTDLVAIDDIVVVIASTGLQYSRCEMSDCEPFSSMIVVRQRKTLRIVVPGTYYLNGSDTGRSMQGEFKLNGDHYDSSEWLSMTLSDSRKI